MNLVAQMKPKKALPRAIITAWESDTQAKLGGILALAGIDVSEAFMPRSIRDHPWLGLTIQFPFPEVGPGKITRCLTHPRGQLMFDVQFQDPVPPIHGWVDDNGAHFHVACKESRHLLQTEHRFFGFELVSMRVSVVEDR